MLLKLISLKKTFLSSAGSRYSYHFYNKLFFSIKPSKLSIYKRWKSGRNDSGKVIIRTKSSILKKIKSISINYNFRYFRLGFVSSLYFIPFKNKLLSLVYYSNGSFTYYISSELTKLFSFIYYNLSKKFKKLKLTSIFFMLFQVKKLSFISCVELVPGKGCQYSRSSGTKSRLIKLDDKTYSTLLQLPSGVKKIFSFYSMAMLDRVSMLENSKCFNGKAGYWRTFGNKPLVRGVAMNPVDHPHGGRAKSVKYPRTPWGKTTKFK